MAVKRINGQEVRYFYDIQAPGASFQGPQPLDVLESANRVTRVIDREGNICDHENHSQAGGPVGGTGKFGLRRKVNWTESGKGNAPLREGEPLFWEMRQLQDCDCLAPVQVSQPFRSDDNLQFDAMGMPLDYPSEFFEYGGDPVHRQVTAYEYRGFGESIRWEKTYDTFERFSRELTYREPRAFDDNPIYDGLDFTHSYQYDEAGNRIRHDAPDVTRGVDQPQAITESWQYNEFGQVVRHTDPNGNITRYSYHQGGLLGLSPGDINSQGTYRGYLASMTRGASGSARQPHRPLLRFLQPPPGRKRPERKRNGLRVRRRLKRPHPQRRRSLQDDGRDHRTAGALLLPLRRNRAPLPVGAGYRPFQRREPAGGSRRRRQFQLRHPLRPRLARRHETYVTTYDYDELNRRTST